MTRPLSLIPGITLIMLVALVAAPVSAIDTVAMNLEQLAARANRIFTSRVIDIQAGTVEAGGGLLPVTIYRVQVGEAFKGQYPTSGKGGSIVEIRMVGNAKSAFTTVGPLGVTSICADMPRLELGQQYVLFTTTPSRVGLSTTVGLGQGSFRVYRRYGEAVARNAIDNDGLFRGMRTNLAPRGPLPYGELARQIRSVLAQAR